MLFLDPFRSFLSGAAALQRKESRALHKLNSSRSASVLVKLVPFAVTPRHLLIHPLCELYNAIL